MAAIRGLDSTVQRLVLAIGDEGEDERGNRTGTGVRGRIMRLEIRFGDWRNRIVGALGAGSVLIVALWWLVQDKVGHVFK
jgi:hypothetical protein